LEPLTLPFVPANDALAPPNLLWAVVIVALDADAVIDTPFEDESVNVVDPLLPSMWRRSDTLEKNVSGKNCGHAAARCCRSAVRRSQMPDAEPCDSVVVREKPM
jgi:hypothetical protein